MKISRPHDKFFKETFSHVEVAQDFVFHYLPESLVNLIDINTIEPQKDSFINPDLQEQFADLLFQCHILNEKGYLYFLFEHKSQQNKQTFFQLLKYMVEIWETKAIKQKAKKLPIIIPLVLYHGEEKWHLPRSLGDWINGYDQLPEDVKVYIPNFEYFLHDITQYKEDEKQMNAMLKIIQLMFRDVFIKDHDTVFDSVVRGLYYINELEDESTATAFFEAWMRYVLHAANTLTNADIHDIIEHVEKTFPEGSEIVMTLAEHLEEKGRNEGIKEGRKQGKKEGIKEGVLKTATRLIEKYIAKIPDEMLQELEKQEIATLESIIENVYEHKTLEEIKEYLK